MAYTLLFIDGTRGRIRTGTLLRAGDFESPVSTNFTTLAYLTSKHQFSKVLEVRNLLLCEGSIYSQQIIIYVSDPGLSFYKPNMHDLIFVEALTFWANWRTLADF
jgi:hypothetical protein